VNTPRGDRAGRPPRGVFYAVAQATSLTVNVVTAALLPE
jgi:hypothetical protein